MVDLGGYVIILVETRDKKIKLYGECIATLPHLIGPLVSITRMLLLLGRHPPCLRVCVVRVYVKECDRRAVNGRKEREREKSIDWVGAPCVCVCVCVRMGAERGEILEGVGRWSFLSEVKEEDAEKKKQKRYKNEILYRIIKTRKRCVIRSRRPPLPVYWRN